MPAPTTRVTSSKVLAAMAHPARRRLLDVLAVDDAATVSAMAVRTGLAVGSVSHHLRVLAEAGLVEEAPDRAKDRREHWWRAATSGLSWSTRDFEGDATAEVVAAAASTLNLEHHVDKVRAWQSAPAELRERWSDAAFATDSWLLLTPDELAELSVELNDVLRRRYERTTLDDDPARISVFVFAHGVPAEP